VQVLSLQHVNGIVAKFGEVDGEELLAVPLLDEGDKVQNTYH
jgi:hypothetical protein